MSNEKCNRCKGVDSGCHYDEDREQEVSNFVFGLFIGMVIIALALGVYASYKSHSRMCDNSAVICK